MLCFNPLNAKLNPTRHLLALLEAHHILDVSMIKVIVMFPMHLYRPSSRWKVVLDKLI